MFQQFPHYLQLDAMDCGPTCLRMIAKYYGRSYTLQTLRKRSFITREGVSLLGVSDAAESIGFRSMGVKISFEQLIKDAVLPCILHWNQNHFVVCYSIKEKSSSFLKKKKANVEYIISIADPAHGKLKMNKSDFSRCWLSSKINGQDTGTALFLQPSPSFYNSEDDGGKIKYNIRFFSRYLIPYKKQYLQLVISVLIGSLLQLIFPFLTQIIVDDGIRVGNLNFIKMVLIAQIVLFISKISVDFIRSWILLHISVRINITLISDFLAKLMRLPVSFFDTKIVGDIMQRIGDHSRIESFLTGSSLNTLFSFVNFFIFGCVLGYYSLSILSIFIAGNFFYVLWVIVFMKYRRELDHRRFTLASDEQSSLYQLVLGMQEIKLNNCEKKKRWQWEQIQVKLFNISIKGLAIGQYQQLGSVFFSHTTGILITFLAANEVVKGEMTLGMMMALTYIIGQLSGPIEQFIGFIQSFQDAKISFERISEIHDKEDEDKFSDSFLTTLPINRTIFMKDIWFSYDGAERNYVLENINLEIPHNQTTAIVGASGSGKTTLLKLLLGFYSPNKGEIYIDNTHLRNINLHLWRRRCGAVMQEGFIFSDTIANNIAVGEEVINEEYLLQAVKIANIQDFIESLPLKYNTKIGMEGNGISQGQRQRILMARTIYKNPDFLFFDEATNALDAKNERIIMDNLQAFYKGKTVVVVAHRLSTVQNADKIIVMDKGKIIEQGTHEELVVQNGIYYQLIKNQLELGN
ncbi:MAG: peptidase domain-containing ABC transporter [Bacteroidales bacterium]|nr:peptidase domain-containing ABC transporter [Bacteroidales bacterium]